MDIDIHTHRLSLHNNIIYQLQMDDDISNPEDGSHYQQEDEFEGDGEDDGGERVSGFEDESESPGRGGG